MKIAIEMHGAHLLKQGDFFLTSRFGTMKRRTPESNPMIQGVTHLRKSSNWHEDEFSG
jgi:hypothetical protein